LASPLDPAIIRFIKKAIKPTLLWAGHDASQIQSRSKDKAYAGNGQQRFDELCQVDILYYPETR
jgi:hypothetical protein